VQRLVQEHAEGPAKREFAGEHLVEDDAKAVDVEATVHLVGLAAGLLRANVRRRAQDLAVEGHGDLADVALGQAEVGHDRGAIGPDQDVQRLDVALDDPQAVGVVQGLGDAERKPCRLLGRRPTCAQQVGQGHALNEVADQVRDAGLSADLVDGDDAGVAQLGGAAVLAQEAIQVVGRVTDVVEARHLDGHDPVQFGVPGLVHGAKGALPHGFDKLKLSEPVSAGPPVGRGPGLQVRRRSRTRGKRPPLGGRA
jgi:hypothetical protein